MRFNSILIFLISLISLYSQAQIPLVDLDLKSLDIPKPNFIFDAEDENSGDFCIFLQKGKHLYAINFSASGELGEKLYIKLPSASLDFQLANTFFDGKKYNIVYAMDNEIIRYSFNFKALKVSSETIPYPETNCRLFTDLRKGNEYILFFTHSGSPELGFMLFNDKPASTLDYINIPDNGFSIKEFEHSIKPSKGISLHEALEYHNILHAETIYSDIPTSMYSSSRPVKLYQTQKGITISLDISDGFTTLMDISLKEKNASIQYIPYNQKTSCKDCDKTYNSFLSGNQLYQIYASMFVDLFVNRNGKLRTQIVNTQDLSIQQSFELDSEFDAFDWVVNDFKESKLNRTFKSNLSTSRTRTKIILRKIVVRYGALLVEENTPKDITQLTTGSYLGIGIPPASESYVPLINREDRERPRVKRRQFPPELEKSLRPFTPYAYAYHHNFKSVYASFDSMLDKQFKTTNNKPVEHIFNLVDDYLYAENGTDYMTIFGTKKKVKVAYIESRKRRLKICNF